MQNKKSKKNKLKQIVPIVISAVIGAFLGYFGVMYLDTKANLESDLLPLLSGLIIAFYAQLILHETGHLVFGVLTGYGFVSFRISSFTWYRKRGKIHFGKYALAGTSGQCLLAPPKMKEGKIPYRLYNFGGALMNLIVSAIAYILYCFVDLGSLWNFTCIMLVLIGILFAFTNGVPMRLGGVDNDGYNAVSMGKNSAALRAFWLQLKINEVLTEGIRLKDMPEEWFAKASEEASKNSMVTAIEAVRCNRLLDEMKFEEANQEIAELIQRETGMIGLHKMLLQVDQIFCEVMGEQKEEVLNQFKEKELISFMKSMKNFPSVVRTKYAYTLLIEKDSQKAEKLKKQFEKVIKKHPYESEVKSEWELVKMCEKNCMN